MNGLAALRDRQHRGRRGRAIHREQCGLHELHRTPIDFGLRCFGTSWALVISLAVFIGGVGLFGVSGLVGIVSGRDFFVGRVLGGRNAVFFQEWQIVQVFLGGVRN